MDLGRQHAYTSVLTLPIVECIREKLLLHWQSGRNRTLMEVMQAFRYFKVLIQKVKYSLMNLG